MSDDDTLSFLLKFSHKPFVQVLIKNVVTEWLSQIQENIDLLKEQGFSSGEALLKTIPDCFFSENVELYFKLSEQAYDDKYLELIGDALSLVKKTSTTAAEECTSEIINKHASESNNKIAKLKEELAEKEIREKTLCQKLNDTNKSIQQYQCQITEVNNILHNTENELSEIQHELDRYHALERYTETENNHFQPMKYQYTSIGQIIHDYNDKIWICRLADISENGVITPFIMDESVPHYFANRARLYWKNGPDTNKALGIWNWNAIPRDTDPEKDYLETDYCYSIKLTQIIQLPTCESLDDIVSLLKSGFSSQFTFNKILFVCEENHSLKGVLCSSTDFKSIEDKKVLKTTVYTLPNYNVRVSDVIDIAGIKVYKYVSLGIPQTIFPVCDPYETVKSLIISRIKNSDFHEYELSKKEVQRYRHFLKSIPSQEIIQELTLAYNCTKEKAQEYIDGFINLADTYLSSDDLDINIISRAIRQNASLLELCKQQLADEWKVENTQMLAEAELKLDGIMKIAEAKQKEIAQLEDDKEKLFAEIEQLQFKFSQREQLASEVETKATLKIEKAKQNIADFINSMTFISAISSTANSNDIHQQKLLSVFSSHIECKESGEIDDVDTFEEELSENLTLIGYDNEQSNEISQAISFGLSENIPLVISENSKLIAQCLAAVLNGGTLSEIFIPINGISIEDLSDAINDNLSKTTPMVCLIHGIFDGYNINLFNAISNIMQNWKNIVMLLSLEGIQSNMISSRVWNHAIYIDGDSCYEKKEIGLLHSFKVFDILNLYDRAIDVKSKSYKDSKNAIKLFTNILTNTQISLYSRYLSAYNTLLNNSRLILTQLIVVARSMSDIDHLKSIFHENGIYNGERMLDLEL
jgi:hypothetical protein